MDVQAIPLQGKNKVKKTNGSPKTYTYKAALAASTEYFGVTNWQPMSGLTNTRSRTRRVIFTKKRRRICTAALPPRSPALSRNM